jgi:hypothetical protein
MPHDDDYEVITRIVRCVRCQGEGLYTLDVGRGDFSYTCDCTTIQAPEIHLGPNGPGEIRCTTLPSRMIGIRHSRRMLTTGQGGRLWREVWRCAEGTILQSGPNFVAILATEDRRQIWFDSFGAAFSLLTNQPWRPPEGGIE